MTQWEYKTFVMEQKSSFWGYSNFEEKEVIENELNELGQEGWELVSGIPNAELHGKTTKVMLIFKRQKNNS